MKKFLVCLVLSLAGIVGISNNVFADGSAMKISPVANSFNIKAGDVQNYTFSIENSGTEKYSFKVYTAPYNVTDENYSNDFTKETNYSQITRWITFQDDSGSFVSNPVYSVEAGEKKTIVYRISVPEDIPEGGQYATIMAETLVNSEATEENSMSIASVTRVGLILIGHGSGSTDNIAEIVDYKLTGFFTRDEVEASATVKNTGNTDFSATYTLTAKSIFGKTLYTNSDSFVIFPESQKCFSTKWTDTPMFGIFNVSWTVKALDAEKTDSHVILILPIFVIVIALLLLTIIIIWTIILFRKRKERSSRLVV